MKKSNFLNEFKELKNQVTELDSFNFNDDFINDVYADDVDDLDFDFDY